MSWVDLYTYDPGSACLSYILYRAVPNPSCTSYKSKNNKPNVFETETKKPFSRELNMEHRLEEITFNQKFYQSTQKELQLQLYLYFIKITAFPSYKTTIVWQ